jgi:uncharacterized protein YcfL
MMLDTYSAVLSTWGALLATALGAVRLWEFSLGRLRLTTSYLFTTDPERGNEVTIENSSDRPVMITYWELVWADRRFGWTLFERAEEYPDEGSYDVTIPPHARHTLLFSDGHHFAKRNEIDGHKVRLYLKLYLVARRSPVVLSVG